MSIDYIKKVSHAEELANEKLLKARDEARRIIADAQETVNNYSTNRIIQTKKQASDIIKNAKADAESRALAIIGNTSLECKSIEKNSSAKLPEAIAYIIERSVKV
ncbi:MAG: hypothetical protein GX633_00010 [Clostridiales bacterium]|nr:hypothetical protein [Clostridiales bacterium]